MQITIPSHLSDDQLVAEVTRFAGHERDATAHLVAHLAELDARRLYLGAGFSSLFTYCREVLRLSESEAYNRIEAARVARRVPVVLDRLAEGAVSLTTVRFLAPHLTADNHPELLAAASGKSKREVEELVAGRFPRPDVPSSIRKVPPARPILVPSPAAASAPPVAPPPSGPAKAPVPALAGPMAVPPSPPRRSAVTPLALDRYEVRFTASASVCEKLRLAQDLLRHAVPTGDTAEIVDRALTALLEDLARKKFAAVKTEPRSSRSTGSRHIPGRRWAISSFGVERTTPTSPICSTASAMAARDSRENRWRPTGLPRALNSFRRELASRPDAGHGLEPVSDGQT
jgi:hypothetical protein